MYVTDLWSHSLGMILCASVMGCGAGLMPKVGKNLSHYVWDWCLPSILRKHSSLEPSNGWIIIVLFICHPTNLEDLSLGIWMGGHYSPYRAVAPFNNIIDSYTYRIMFYDSIRKTFQRKFIFIYLVVGINGLVYGTVWFGGSISW
jgi:hypothetical protein